MIEFEHKHSHHHLHVWNHTLHALSNFENDFEKFIKKYGIKDLYISSFYHFKTEKEK